MKKYYILGAIILLVIVFVGVKYNSLVKQSNAIDAQWAQVDSVLQRRMDTIDQTIGSIKISNKSEQDALAKITEARKIYMAAQGDQEAQVAAANNYSGQLNGLLLSRAVVQESYATLATPQIIGGLVSGASIEGNENRINVERMRYNELVKDYNNTVSLFPGNVVAKLFGYENKKYFEVAQEAKDAPKIAPNLDF